MKLVHRFLNSGWFRFLSAFGFGWIIHGPCAASSAKHPGIEHSRQAGQTPWWGLVLYGIGIVCGLVGIVLNFSGSLQVGTSLIVVAIALTGSTALQLGHLKKW
jgi:hypothetical protein